MNTAKPAMKRITTRLMPGLATAPVRYTRAAVVDLLADYEDTGLSPAEIEKMKRERTAVVHCCECKRRKTEDCAMQYECDCGTQCCWESDNDYCSWGERKEDENDE